MTGIYGVPACCKNYLKPIYLKQVTKITKLIYKKAQINSIKKQTQTKLQ